MAFDSPLGEQIKQALPHPLRQRLAEAASYWRGRRINAAYAAHHRRARRRYQVAHGGGAGSALTRIGVDVLPAHDASGAVTRPDRYADLISTIAAAARERFDRASELTFFPRVPIHEMRERTADIGALARGEVIIMRIRHPATVPGVAELSRAIVADIERRILGSFAIVDRVFIYRSPASRQQPRASWLWHYDNYPREILKVMFYLSEVTDETAPFEYLRHRQTGRALVGGPLSPGFGHGRYDEAAIAAMRSQGYDACRVTGGPGTMLTFETNVVHRATLAERGHRDVLVLQVRPALAPGYGVVDERWSGSFEHTGFNPDPADVGLVLEGRRD